MELFKNYDDSLIKNRYKNWILFIAIPIGLLLLIEFYFEWPYREFPATSKGTYLKVIFVFAAILMLASFTVLVINYWHFKKNIREKAVRNIHSFLSILLICFWLIFAKIQFLGAFLSKDKLEAVLYLKIPGVIYRNYKSFHVSGIITYWLSVLFIVLQCGFIIYMIQKTLFAKKKG